MWERTGTWIVMGAAAVVLAVAIVISQAVRRRRRARDDAGRRQVKETLRVESPPHGLVPPRTAAERPGES